MVLENLNEDISNSFSSSDENNLSPQKQELSSSTSSDNESSSKSGENVFESILSKDSDQMNFLSQKTMTRKSAVKG